MNVPDPTLPIKRGEIAILLSTRGRPEKLLQVFNSLKASTVGRDKISLWLYVDDDDAITRQAIDGGTFPDVGFPVHWNIGPRTPEWGQTFHVLWQAMEFNLVSQTSRKGLRREFALLHSCGN